MAGCLAWGRCIEAGSSGMAKVAFLGLGAMGFPMAGHLKSKGGYDVTVYNRTRSKSEAWIGRYGGRLAETPCEASKGQDFVLSCVGNDDDLRSITAGDDGAFVGMEANAVFVDHTTASAAIARELHAVARKKGFHFIDAPVSGGQLGAENAELTVMCGGDETAFVRAEQVVAVYSRACVLLGGAGSGQLAKMVNQICVAGIVQSLAEGIHFAKIAGLDIDKLIAAISKGAAQSWQMEVRCRVVEEGMPQFGIVADPLMLKDLGICLAEAQRNGARLPVATLVEQLCAEMKRTSVPNLLARQNGPVIT